MSARCAAIALTTTWGGPSLDIHQLAPVDAMEHILSTRPPRSARPLNGTDAIVAPRASSSCQADSFDTSSCCVGWSRV